MPHYRRMGQVPRKRHTQFRQPDGSLYAEELQGEEGFRSDSSLLYHRHPPTAITAAEAIERQPQPLAPNHPLKPRHFRTHALEVGGDLVDGRQLLLANDDLQICYAAADTTSSLYRPAVGDELVYVESGSGVLESIYGRLTVGAGDYVVVPAACTHRWVPTGGEVLRALIMEASGHVGPPDRYLSRRGQFLEHSPYCERDLRGPEELIQVEQSHVEVLVRHRVGHTRYRYARHPFDVIGWDGYLYPYALNVADFEPTTGRIHQPPPVHQTFEGLNFVVCSFVPRKLDYHALAVPAPYNHANVDADEVLFYCRGDFVSRKGAGLEQGSITLHPAGFTHGPQPGSVEASIGAEDTHELAVMIDTRRPLQLGPDALQVEDEGYAWTWARGAPTTSAGHELMA